MPAKQKFSHRFKRFRLWLKQVILLGRTDWRKASDDANPPHLSRAEREEMRPRFDVSAIKPRNVSTADRLVNLTPDPAVEPVFESAPQTSTPAAPEIPVAPVSRRPKSRVFRRHHREHTHQLGADPLAALASVKLPASRFERFLEKLLRRRD